MSRANLVDGTKIVKVECKKVSLLDFFAETHPILKIKKGERRGKKKMKFSTFDRAKPDLILSEGGKMLRLYVV